MIKVVKLLLYLTIWCVHLTICKEVSSSVGEIFSSLHQGVNVFAHQVSLQRLVSSKNKWKHYCGGAVISPRRIVTAAHCVHNFDVSGIRAVVGENNLVVEEGTEQRRKILAAVHHPNWNPDTIDWDYAVITVDPPFVFNEFVQPISIADPDAVIDVNDQRGRCISAGWKKIRAGQLAKVIQKMDHQMVSREDCRKIYSKINWTITERIVCARAEYGQHICNGYSGGPLVCRYGNDYYLTGIASFTMMPCGQTKFPNGFANVKLVTEWILSI